MKLPKFFSKILDNKYVSKVLNNKYVTKVLENQYVLYFVLFLAVTNLLGYLVLGNLHAIIFFILVGYLVSLFNKNMIVILSVPLILTSIFMIGKKVKEGLETKEDKDNEEKPLSSTQEAELEGEKKEKDKSEIITGPMDKVDDINKDVNVDQELNADKDMNLEPKTTNESMTTYSKKRNRIDYAATVEDAYDDLNKILGGDGIKRLTNDTQKLMTQQVQLANAMKSMTPLLEQAKSMMQGFDMKNLGGLASLAKSFSSSE